MSATRQSTAVIDTPASVTAVTAESLGAGGVQTMADLAEVVPNLSVGNQFGVNRAFIRGIGLTSIDLGGDGAVAFLQDGAQIVRPSEQLSGFYDLDRVEVLRGPQGTLYGRGATAGVINLVTRQPTDEAQGYLNFTYGNFATTSLEAAVGGPLSDIVAARVAVKIDKHDGYGRNLFTGTAIDDRDAQAMRGSLRIKPQDHLIVDVSVDYLHENDDDYAFHYFGPTTTPTAQLPAELYFGGKTILDCCGAHPDPRDIWSSLDPVNKRHGIGATTTVDWTPGGLELKSISAYRNFDRFNEEDLAGSNARLYGRDDYDEQSESYSEDLTWSARLREIDWLAGISYLHERLYGSVKVPTIGLEATLSGGDCTPLTVGAPIACNAQDQGHYWQLGTVTSNAYGGFLQGTKGLAPGLSLTLGARLSQEERTGVGSFIFDAFGIDVATNRSAKWTALTPKLLVEYQWSSDTLIYGSINRGFKSGVINVGSTNPVVNPEYVYAYETGLKGKAADHGSEWTLAAFFYDYKDLQVGFVNAQSVVETVNAAAAHNYGLEAEYIATFDERWRLDVSATYLNAKYTSFSNGYYRDNFATVNVSGNYLDNAPPYSGRVALEYVLPLSGARGRVRFHAEDAYQARVYFTEFNNSDAAQGGYGLLNGSAGWESADGAWRATAWVRNALDKLAVTNEIITSYTYDNVRVGSLNAPRTFGLTISYAF